MISLEWVKDYIDISDQDLEELAVKITQSGINVEKVITNHINNLVIGEVLECVAHPDSDHLHVCKVNVGNTTEQIVCGAPNVREGLKVIVALPGAVLPGDFEIKKSKIRGVESNGMLCALYELGLEEKNDETYAKGIEELGTDASVGEDPLKYLGLDDTLYELDIHKHRNNDCYYHIGFAYEIGAILNRPVTLPDLSFKEDQNNVENYFTLDVETEKCPFYLAKMVKNAKIGESPEFIKKRLLAAGMRPINNVVDISNYVMLEFGQPLHFFDKNRLGNHILVRDAKDKEEVITLDGKRRILSSNDIVITDGNRPVCIAGVMGGENTEVEQDTTDILIEAAIFDPVSIRYTAANLDLRSEASIRYGKGLSYEYTEMALKRACHLLEKYADATILSGCIRHDVIDKTPKVVEFVPEFKALIAEINELLAGNKTEEFNALGSWEEKYAFIEKGLTAESMAVFAILPQTIQQQLFLERDPHGNVQVSLIESEKLFSALVKDKLTERGFTGKFNALHHFFGYEGRCAFPSNFDADYCYSLGYNAFMLIQYGYNGYLSKVSNLSKPAEEWVAGGMPITKMMNIERRNGEDKPVIKKALVELDGKPFKFFEANRDTWAVETAYTYPGAIQYYGPTEVCDLTTRTLALEKGE